MNKTFKAKYFKELNERGILNKLEGTELFYPDEDVGFGAED